LFLEQIVIFRANFFRPAPSIMPSRTPMCRSQAYDNASVTSGIHSGAHRRIKEMLQASFAYNSYYCTKAKPAENLPSSNPVKQIQKELYPIKTHHSIS